MKILKISLVVLISLILLYVAYILFFKTEKIEVETNVPVKIKQYKKADIVELKSQFNPAILSLMEEVVVDNSLNEASNGRG